MISFWSNAVFVIPFITFAIGQARSPRRRLWLMTLILVAPIFIVAIGAILSSPIPQNFLRWWGGTIIYLFPVLALWWGLCGLGYAGSRWSVR